MKPFRRDVFLFRMLGTIFAVEASFLAFAFWKCSIPISGQPVPMISERCPKLGERAETLFVAAVATTLSLLSGVSVNQQSQSSSVSDRALALGDLPQTKLPTNPAGPRTVQQEEKQQASSEQSSARSSKPRSRPEG